MNRQRYLELLEPLTDLMETKHEDYGSNEKGSIPLSVYFPFGHRSYVQMLYVKTMRLVALVDSGKEPNHEKIEDTVRDLVNYSVFYLDYLDESPVNSAGGLHGV